jgi:[ribosomal protein S5]-alanine N-acetyltransferase
MLTHKGTQTIETNRLILRRFELTDAEAVFNNWANDSEVCKFMRWKVHENVDVTRKIIEEWFNGYKSDRTYHWGIQLKDGELIGSLGAVYIDDNDQKAEMGYCIGRAFWGNGYTAEAVRAIIKYMFFDVGLNRIEAYHSVNNMPSGRVMEKAGMKLEGHAKQMYHCAMGFQDCNMYGITKDEWR